MQRLNLTLAPLIMSVASCCSLLCAQQTTASLKGTITDATGAVIGRSDIVLRNEQTHVTRTQLADANGRYALPLLPPGTYDITITAQGFQPETIHGLVVQVGQDAQVDVRLRVGAPTDTVTVSAQQVLTTTDSAAVGTTISNRQVTQLPLNGRQFYSLALLVPGVLPPVPGSPLSFRGGLNAAGANEVSNYFSLDGINNVDAAVAAPSFRSSVDAIQEFRVITGTPEAEYGHNIGAQVVVVTKSGGDSVHGTLFEFLRNDIVEAKPYFTPAGASPPLKRNQFGGVLSGPLRKGKAFFLFDYEGLRSRKGLAFTATVPTLAATAGTFPGLLAVPRGYSSATFSYDSAANTTALNRSALTATQAAASTAGSALLAFYPAPTTAAPVNNYSFAATERESLNQFTLRLDAQPHPRNAFFVSLNHLSDPLTTPNNPLCGSYVIPGFTCESSLTTQLYAAGWNHVLTPRLVNTMRIGFQRLWQARYTDTPYNYDAKYGVPAYVGNPEHIGGVPTTTVIGYASFGTANNLPQDRADNTYDVVDSMVWSKGRHNAKAGFEGTAYRSNNIFLLFGSGGLQFTGANTGNSVADALLGLPFIAMQNLLAPKLHFRNAYTAAYLQDAFEMRPGFTLTYGLRWEQFKPLTSPDHTLSSFDPTGSGRPFAAGLDGYPNQPYATRNSLFGPRVGFAWQPFHTAAVVVRGGYGIRYNEATLLNGFPFLLTAPPVHQLNVFAGPGMLLPNPFVSSGPATLTPGGVSSSFRPAQLQTFSLGVQTQLSPTSSLEVTYLGSIGHHLPNQKNLNQPMPSTGSAAQVQALRPYPNFANVQWVEAQGSSNYNSLLVRLQKNFGALNLLLANTFGKSLDNAPGSISTTTPASPAFAQDSRNIDFTMYGRSDFDIRNRLAVSAVYDLPFGNGKAHLQTGLGKAVLGDTQLAGILTTQTGSPFTAGLSPAVAGYTGIVGSNTGNSTLATGVDRPDLVPGQDPNAGPHTRLQWFNNAAFQLPAPGTFGNAGRNILRGPGFNDLDVNVARRVPLWRESSLQLRFEVFNVFNRPNFGLPSANISAVDANRIAMTNGTFNTISSAMANDARQMQAALKFTF